MWLENADIILRKNHNFHILYVTCVSQWSTKSELCFGNLLWYPVPLNTRRNQTVSGLNLFLHNNSNYILTKIVLYKVVSMGLHAMSPGITSPLKELQHALLET
jgi:hypothetical protein